MDTDAAFDKWWQETGQFTSLRSDALLAKLAWDAALKLLCNEYRIMPKSTSSNNPTAQLKLRR